jgi:hypothetical protein
LEKVEYFRGIDEDALHDLMYGLEGIEFEEGDILQRPGEETNAIYIV